MDTNMAGLNDFQKSLPPCDFDKSSLSIGRVKKKILQDLGHGCAWLIF